MHLTYYGYIESLLYVYSSEIIGLSLMKRPSKMLRYLPYLWAQNESTKQNPLVLCIPKKYHKFWSVLLSHFIKHKPFISEECQI